MIIIAILFPSLSFFIRGKILYGFICVFLQIIIIGWLPAVIWAVYDKSKSDNKALINEMEARLINMEKSNNGINTESSNNIDSIDYKIIEMCKWGGLLAATKICKDAKGLSFIDAKKYVEKLAIENNIEIKKVRISGKKLMIIVGIVWVIIIIIYNLNTTSTKNPVDSAITKESLKRDSIYRQNAVDNELREIEQEKIEAKKYNKSKAGKINKKHPEWSKEDCKKIANNEVWIGMSYGMLVYMRGNPNQLNTSNYGHGDETQACWQDYNPSCFYFNDDDQIIKSYN